MAVHCGCCGARLADGSENYGRFQVSPSFEGWNQEPNKPALVQDTCEDCYQVLVAVTTKAANEIVREHKGVNDKLRAALHKQRESEADFERAEAEFRRNYSNRSSGMASSLQAGIDRDDERLLEYRRKP